VLSPAVSGTLRDATGGWEAAVFLDAGLVAAAVVLLALVQERRSSRVLGASEDHRARRFTRAPAPARGAPASMR
jgi:hypothetical protein